MLMERIWLFFASAEHARAARWPCNVWDGWIRNFCFDGGEGFMVSSEHIYHVLRQEILSLELTPGTQVREEDLAERFGVSRTPVRTAISRLSAERLVQVVPRKGTFVAEIDFAYSRQLVFLRTSVEQRLLPMLCREPPEGLLERLEENLARQRILLAGSFQPLQFYRLDNRFHELYFSAMELDAVWKVLQQFHAHYTRFRMLDMRESGLFGQFFEEHRQIVALIRCGAAGELTRLIARHLEGPLDRIDPRQAREAAQGEATER